MPTGQLQPVSTRLKSFTLAIVFVILGTATPAFADLTAFAGFSPSPERHGGWGAALGFGLLVIGFEFEYSNLKEDAVDEVPGLKTGMGTLLVQTPVAIHGWRFYGTIGGGIYHERSGELTDTSFVSNVGGGVKISIAEPLRLRFDYRILSLHGDALHDHVHRLYAGLNLAF